MKDTRNDSLDSSRPVLPERAQVTDPFWGARIDLVGKEVIPYQWEALNDKIADAPPSFCMRNFKLAGKLNKARAEKGDQWEAVVWPTDKIEMQPADISHMEERFYGWVFQDSDCYKWIEAVGYFLQQRPDPALEQVADDAIDMICEAQLANGYLNTFYSINDRSKIFSNLKEQHELYCFGHLVEGAIAYYQATGKDKLLKAAEKFADYIAGYFGREEGKCKGYPGHEIAEMALVRLYELTGKAAYLELSRFFIEERGARPYYFDKEAGVSKQDQQNTLRYAYFQAHLPVRQQEEAVGHAVRAVYLYAGMADVARLTGDKKLYQACRRLWQDITGKKMYITGGIGGTHIGEAFSFAYDLPNDTAYAETCASIGLVFFARRMLQIEADSTYGDIMELSLYNGILSGMALDGKSFFYVNPLEVLPEACHRDERKFHVKPVRQKWFGCACCPPNIARLLTSVAAYAFTETEEMLLIHLYMGSIISKTIDGKELTVHITSEFPWDGKVGVTIRTADGQPSSRLTVALRIPGWCSAYTVNGQAGLREGEKGAYGQHEAAVKNGYLYLSGVWQDGDQLDLYFSMVPRLMQADPLVRENIGKTAVMRGPVVYCMEEADNGKNLHLCSLYEEWRPQVVNKNIAGQEITAIQTRGCRRGLPAESAGLYQEYKGNGTDEEAILTWIPYYAWANRGEGEMQVWTAVKSKNER